MNFSRIFIQRPVATIIIMLALIVAGFATYFYLPISELPNVDFPTLMVRANLSGADPETMAVSVATPLEKALSTVSGIDSMSSVSTQGSTKIVIQFDLSRDIDAAAQDVQSALLQVQHKLPSQMTDPPTIRKLNPADAPVLFLALTADNLSMTKLDDYAENYLAPNLSMIEGVANVDVFGAQQYAVRIHVNPNAIASRNLSLADVGKAVAALNSNQATGTLQTLGSYRSIKVDGGLDTAAQFANAIIGYKNGAPIKLSDVAKVENSTANDKAVTWYNNRRAIVLAIERQPGSNTVAVVNNVLHVVQGLKGNLPGGAKLNVVYNRGQYIKAAIDDVQLTLLFAIILVIAVVYLFLQNFTFTIIAALSLPVSVIATFAAMFLLNYSLDNLSLMALVLAVGFVIDDAIVVLENIVRYVEQGMDRLSASIKGSKEIGFTVVAMTISLVAVFIPIFFMGGIVGRLFNEFAAVVGITILFSGLVALTLIPMLSSRLIRHQSESAVVTSKFSRLFITCRDKYVNTLGWALDHWVMMLNFAAVMVVATAVLFYLVPKGFIPSQDDGMIFGGVRAPEGITYQNFVKEQQQVKQIILQNKNVASVISSVGQGANATAGASTGRIIIKLKPLNKRKLGVTKVIHQLRQQLLQAPGLKVFLANPPAIRIGGKSANGNYQFVLQGMDWSTLEDASKQMQAKLAQIPGVVDVDTDLQLNNPEYRLHILRDKAAALGVTPEQIESTLYSAYGQQQISSIMRSDGDYNVIMDIDPEYQKDIGALDSLSLKTQNGGMVPLSDLVQVNPAAGPLSINHYGQLPAITLSFNLRSGYSLGGVATKIQAMAKNSLPADISGNFSGTAAKFQQSLTTLPLLLLITILVIYMVLAILYENFIHPLTILTALPFAVFGALLCLYLFNMELDLFSFIGLIMLVGITKKNGIIMIDFALDAMRNRKIPAKDAILEACSIRFRPIMMTTVSAIVAALPIALGLGAGGETRQGLGVAVVGGLFFSQLITLYITPVFFVVMAKLFPKAGA